MWQRIVGGKLIQPTSTTVSSGDVSYYEFPITGTYVSELERDGSYVSELEYEGVYDD